MVSGVGTRSPRVFVASGMDEDEYVETSDAEEREEMWALRPSSVSLRDDDHRPRKRIKVRRLRRSVSSGTDVH